MLQEIDFGGIYLPPFALHLLLATPIFFLCRWLLAKSGLLGRVWYLALFEVALFVIVLSVMLPFA